MIEEDGPVDPADEVGSVEDPGGVRDGVGTWALPVAGTITACPKCRTLSEVDSTTYLHVQYHAIQEAFDASRDLWVQARDFPCIAVSAALFPERDEFTGRGGEHLCVKCTRCTFGWVEQVAIADSVYFHPRSEGDE